MLLGRGIQRRGGGWIAGVLEGPACVVLTAD